VVEDSSAAVYTSAATDIVSNGGYGINCTVATTAVTPGALPESNTSGSYSADCGAIQRTAYTPTIGCGTGTATTITAAGNYVVDRLHKTATFQVVVTDTTNGSCATALTVSLPTTATESTTVAGRGDAVSGKMLQGSIVLNSATMTVRNYDNSYPGADGESLIIGGTYLTQ